MIAYFFSGEKVALLIAGYEVEDGCDEVVFFDGHRMLVRENDAFPFKQ